MKITDIRVDTDEGLIGYSESFRVPPGVAMAVMHGSDSFLGRFLIGEELTHPERLWQKLYDSIMHYNRRGWALMCLGALDIAVWDLYGKKLNQPVYELLGGAQRGYFQTPESNPVIEVVPYCTIVSDQWDSEAMVESQVERALILKEKGYRAFKVEPMMSSVKNILELATRARDALGPDLMLAVDVGYRFNDVQVCKRICRVLEELDVYFFETPFPVDSFDPYARLAESTSIPLAMGEHAVSRWELQHMIDYGKVHVVQPYMNTCGGITEAKRIVEIAQSRGALVIPGNWSTQILGAATVHLALYSTITPYIEFAPAEVFDSPLRQKIQDLGHPVVNGAIQTPSRPGIGIELHQDLIDQYRLHSPILGSA
ncbi:mandelate racemase/muconate lactonizing enzyme family protein [Chloroflexi bacterium TSY]|nr:mandelate racemase/muconate lactonizing enzyme family protein [Chloroflexi bacterium TSY]